MRQILLSQLDQKVHYPSIIHFNPTINLLTFFLGPPKGCCISECVFNATGILVDGKMDKTIAQKVLTQNVLADAAWVKVINSAIDKCLVDGNYVLN